MAVILGGAPDVAAIVGARDKKQRVALHIAAAAGVLQCMRMLLDAGGGGGARLINAPSEAGTPLCCALGIISPQSADRCATLLIERGADALARDPVSGETCGAIIARRRLPLALGALAAR